MDEVLDGLEAVTSLGDLAEASVDIAEVADAVGLVDFDVWLMDVLSEDPFDALGQISNRADVLSEMDGHFAEWTDRMLVELEFPRLCGHSWKHDKHPRSDRWQDENDASLRRSLRLTQYVS